MLNVKDEFTLKLFLHRYEVKKCFSASSKGSTEVLTQEERGKLLTFRKSDFSIRVIATKINRSNRLGRMLVKKMQKNYALLKQSD